MYTPKHLVPHSCLSYRGVLSDPPVVIFKKMNAEVKLGAPW